MSWYDCRCTSQTTLRRAPWTGMQQAKSWKTGGRDSGLFIAGIIGIARTAALRDRLAEAAADVARGAVWGALGHPQDGRAVRPRGQMAVAHRRDRLPFEGEPGEEVVLTVV